MKKVYLVIMNLLVCATIKAEESQWMDIHADMQNLFLFRTDSDFDTSTPYYNENGQTVGAFATVFKPYLTFHALEHIRLFYETEIGLNYWSKQNPDQERAISSDVFVMKHRQIFTEGNISRFGFKVGFQHFCDPSGLFINHWLGLAHLYWSLTETAKIGGFVGEIPDQTYEGIDVRENNFKRDIMIFGWTGEFMISEDIDISSAIIGLYDSHIVGKTRWLIAPSIGFRWRHQIFSVSLDGVFQYGEDKESGLGEHDQRRFAWAIQGTLSIHKQPIEIVLNGLLLSPDDDYDGNKTNSSFLYSGKNRSATVLFTEDELRDWYDNMDERMGVFRGGFYTNRAGLFIGDVKATYTGLKWFRPSLVTAVSSVLNPQNAMKNTFVGVEVTGILTFVFQDRLFFVIQGGSVIPGYALSALVNNIDRARINPVGFTEMSLSVRY